MRLPTPGLLAAYAAGIGWLQWQPRLPPLPWALAAGGMLLVLLAIRFPPAPGVGGPWRLRAALGTIIALAGAAILGTGYAAARAELRLADALPAEWEGEDIDIVGVVDDLPRESERGVRFPFAVERVLTPRAAVPARISLAWQVGWPDADRGVTVPALVAGERWLLTVRLRRPHGTVNPGGFDLEAWLLERNLRATGYVRPDGTSRRIAAFGGRPRDYVQRARERIRSRIAAVLPAAPYAGVVVALAIGDQGAIPDAQWSVFNRTGVAHLVSISGLHVTVFAALAGGLALAGLRCWTGFTSRLPARKGAAAVGLGAAAAYVLLAGAEVPALRTLAMLAVATAGLWLSRPGSAQAVWLWALVVVLSWDPWAVVAPGFWLSFLAVGLLLYAGAGRGDEVGGSRLQRAWQAIVAAARAQWVVTIGLVPATLALFQQVSLIGPVANALAIPVVTFAVVPLALTAIVVPMAGLWQAAHALLALLMRVLEPLADLPAAAWAQHAPAPWTVAVAALGSLLVLAPPGVPGRGAAGLLFLPLFLVLPPRPPPGAFRLVVLDVGQGTAILVQTHTHALVYDAGPRWHESADAGGRIVAPFLRAAGVRHVDLLVVSHRDTDHSGGALSLLASVPIGMVLSSLEDGHPIVAAADARSATLRCARHQHWEWDGVAFTVLHPEPDHYADAARRPNDLSCVVRVTGTQGRVLLAGDIEARSEVQLVAEQPEALRAEVLLVPHHGSRTSSTRAFVTAVGAAHAVFTVGYANRFGHPRADVVARYEERGGAVHRTDVAGALTFTIGPAPPGAPSGERARLSRYWHALPRPP